jgi:AcrR family transcriptional regulator
LTTARDTILHAATNIFMDGGLASLSVRAIAQRAGISTIGIYNHFSGKQGILDALYTEGFERLAAAMAADTETTDAKSAVLAAASCYLDIADNFDAHYRLMFGAAGQAYRPHPQAQAAADHAFAALVEKVARFLTLQPTDKQCREKALQLWALVHGYVTLRQHWRPDVATRAQIMSAVATHLDGLLLSPAPGA